MKYDHAFGKAMEFIRKRGGTALILWDSDTKDYNACPGSWGKPDSKSLSVAYRVTRDSMSWNRDYKTQNPESFTAHYTHNEGERFCEQS